MPNSVLAYGQTVVNQVVRCARYWLSIALGALTCPAATGESTTSKHNHRKGYVEEFSVLMKFPQHDRLFPTASHIGQLHR